MDVCPIKTLNKNGIFNNSLIYAQAATAGKDVTTKVSFNERLE